MEREWTDIFKDVIDAKMNARERDTRVLDIKNVMESLQVNSEKAMDVLKIPQNQRTTYAGLLSHA